MTDKNVAVPLDGFWSTEGKSDNPGAFPTLCDWSLGKFQKSALAVLWDTDINGTAIPRALNMSDFWVKFSQFQSNVAVMVKNFELIQAYLESPNEFRSKVLERLLAFLEMALNHLEKYGYDDCDIEYILSVLENDFWVNPSVNQGIREFKANHDISLKA